MRTNRGHVEGTNQKGDKIGILGLGGLGHMAIKFAKRLKRSYR